MIGSWLERLAVRSARSQEDGGAVVAAAPDGAAHDAAAMSSARRWLYEAAYPGAGEPAKAGRIGRDEAIDLARDFALAHFPGVAAVFGFGSAFNGGFRPYSDIDLVIALPRGRFLRNRCLLHRGVPMELHVFGLEGADRVIGFARRSGNASVLLPIAQGEVLLDQYLIADEIKRRFAQAYEAGPEPAPATAIHALRHMITTQLLDLAGGLSPEEATASALSVYPLLMRLLYATGQSWRHRGKWAARHGERLMGGLAAKVHAAYRAAMEGDPEPLLALALDVLDRAGGPLWAPHVDEVTFRETA